jgi:hypothetical protein
MIRKQPVGRLPEAEALLAGILVRGNMLIRESKSSRPRSENSEKWGSVLRKSIESRRPRGWREAHSIFISPQRTMSFSSLLGELTLGSSAVSGP